MIKNKTKPMINTEHKYFVPAAVFVCLTLVVFAVIISQSTVRQRAPQGAAASVPVPPPMPLSSDGFLHMISGTITAVGSSGITLQAALPGTSQAVALTVGVVPSTPITEQVPKDMKTFQSEMQAYQKLSSNRAAQATGTPAMPPTPPMPSTSKTVTLADLKTGMVVAVTPAPNTKQDATSFEAANIVAQASLVPPPLSTMAPVAASSSTPPLPPPLPPPAH